MVNKYRDLQAMQVERGPLQAPWLWSTIRVGEEEKEDHYGIQNTLIYSMHTKHTHMILCTHILYTHSTHTH